MHVERGTHNGVRKPLSWDMLKRMEEAAKEWRVGGRVAWIGLAMTCHFRLKALFAEVDRSDHAVYGLRRGDVNSYAGDRQVKGGCSPGVDTVEVPFKVFKPIKDERVSISEDKR